MFSILCENSTPSLFGKPFEFEWVERRRSHARKETRYPCDQGRICGRSLPSWNPEAATELPTWLWCRFSYWGRSHHQYDGESVVREFKRRKDAIVLSRCHSLRNSKQSPLARTHWPRRDCSFWVTSTLYATWLNLLSLNWTAYAPKALCQFFEILTLPFELNFTREWLK